MNMKISELEKRHCYNCGNNKFIKRGSIYKCSKCGSPPTVLKEYINKHKKLRTKVENE